MFAKTDGQSVQFVFGHRKLNLAGSCRKRTGVIKIYLVYIDSTHHLLEILEHEMIHQALTGDKIPIDEAHFAIKVNIQLDMFFE